MIVDGLDQIGFEQIFGDVKLIIELTIYYYIARVVLHLATLVINFISLVRGMGSDGK